MNIVEPPNHPVHIGIDVAKASLQIDLQGKSRKLPNTKAGHQTLLGLLPEDAFIIMESTGSYHIAPMECFQAAGIPVAIVNPVRVKQFGKARGTLAKTDPVDAALLTDFGRAFLPRPTPPRDTERVLLGELVNLRDTLGAEITMWNNLVEHQQSGVSRKLSTAQARAAAKAMTDVESRITKLIKDSSTMAPVAAILQETKGVGAVTTAVLVAQMPELGRINRREAAALGGLAPCANDSGKHEGKRYIRGGRPRIKRALYLAALSAVRFHSTLKITYKTLRAAGKPAKVALIAIARKLLVILNAKLKEYYATLVPTH
jgi:transposase